MTCTSSQQIKLGVTASSADKSTYWRATVSCMHRQCVFTYVVCGAYLRVLVLTDRVESESGEGARVMTVGSTLVPCFIR